MAWGDECWSDCSFQQNHKCTKLVGKCLKDQDHSKLIEENVKSSNELRRKKAERSGGLFGFFSHKKKK
jgi:hypothetical protein